MIGRYKEQFAQLLAKHTGLEVKEILAMVEIPPENIPGDLAFPCFTLSKQLKKAPPMIAQELAQTMISPEFDKFEAIGGYLNAHINKKTFIEHFFSPDTKNPESGLQNAKTKVLVEYMNANPNKPLHIGQARNVCIGDSIIRMHERLGYDVHAFNYGDDSGVNVGYNIVGHLYYGYALDTDKKYDHYCGKIYEQMRKQDEDPKFKQLLSQTLLKIEEGTDEQLKKLHFDYTRRCAIEQIRTCRRMNAFFDAVAWETDILHIKFFAEAIDLLRDKGVIKFVEEGDAKGCRVLDLSSLPEYAKEEKQYQILIKSDGVATYIAKDIAFALRKLGYLSKDFGYDILIEDPRGETIFTTNAHPDEKLTKHHFWNYDTAITVIDNRQIPAQTIVKSAFTLLEYTQKHKSYLPLGYGVVYLTPSTLIKLWYTLSPEETTEKRLPFASRKWRTVTIDEMLQMLHSKAYFETKERNPGKLDTRLDDVAEAMAVSALRFFLIRGDITKDIVFDLDEALDMQGETWAYILYTGARMQSIIDAAWAFDTPAVDYDLLQEESEFALVKKISGFDDLVLKAKEDLAPHYIAKYCFDLAQLVNSYYAHAKILVENEALKHARISLLKKTRDTLKQAMELIGMVFLERM